METESALPGTEAVIDKLSEVLFIQAGRAFMQQTGAKPGLLAVLFDPKLSKAVQAVHEQPGFRWNVLKLAERPVCLVRPLPVASRKSQA